jgi:hypothetical protein
MFILNSDRIRLQLKFSVPYGSGSGSGSAPLFVSLNNVDVDLWEAYKRMNYKDPDANPDP